MRLSLCLAAVAMVAWSSNTARATDTAAVMCQQFAIDGAAYTVAPALELFEDFVPAHHAPRNIPIDVALPDDAIAYIHFPIVEDGTYLIYATEPDRLVGLKQKNRDVIPSNVMEAAPACSSVLTGGLSADIELGDVTGPRPIAIELSNGQPSTLRLIISRSPINSSQ